MTGSPQQHSQRGGVKKIKAHNLQETLSIVSMVVMSLVYADLRCTSIFFLFFFLIVSTLNVGEYMNEKSAINTQSTQEHAGMQI